MVLTNSWSHPSSDQPREVGEHFFEIYREPESDDRLWGEGGVTSPIRAVLVLE